MSRVNKALPIQSIKTFMFENDMSHGERRRGSKTYIKVLRIICEWPLLSIRNPMEINILDLFLFRPPLNYDAGEAQRVNPSFRLRPHHPHIRQRPTSTWDRQTQIQIRPWPGIEPRNSGPSWWPCKVEESDSTSKWNFIHLFNSSLLIVLK